MTKDQGCVAIREIRLSAKRPLKISQNPQTIGDHIKERRLGLKLLHKESAVKFAVDEMIMCIRAGKEPPLKNNSLKVYA